MTPEEERLAKLKERHHGSNTTTGFLLRYIDALQRELGEAEKEVTRVHHAACGGSCLDDLSESGSKLAANRLTEYACPICRRVHARRTGKGEG